MSVWETLVLSHRAPGVAQVTMARQAVFNAFDETMIAELDEVFTELAADARVRVVVLAGDGKHFSAGAAVDEACQHRLSGVESGRCPSFCRHAGAY